MIEDANPTPCAVFISCVSEGGISGGMLASAISDEGEEEPDEEEQDTSPPAQRFELKPVAGDEQ